MENREIKRLLNSESKLICYGSIPKHKSIDLCFGIVIYSLVTLVTPHGRGDPHIPKQTINLCFGIDNFREEIPSTIDSLSKYL